jgi:predicted nucleic acid-binding protein
MSRVYWDTMLFIYLLEDNKQFASRIEAIYDRMQTRGDFLFTSHLSFGEVLAGARGSAQKAKAIRENFSALDVQLLPFDGGAVDRFASLRAVQKLATVDSIHLACAAAKGIDLFLTGDRQLTRQIVPGIQFISSIENSPI